MSDQSRQKPDQNRPLRGIRVLLTRPSRPGDSLAKKLESLGAETVSHPMITFSAAPDQDRLKERFGRLSEFSMISILSRQAAKAFDKHRQQPESLPPIAAIGTGTRDCLQQHGHEVQFLPDESNSESMGRLLIEQFRMCESSKPILILRANRGSNALMTALTEAKVPFEELAVYTSNDVSVGDPGVCRELSAGQFHWLTITSSSIARNVANLFADHIGTTKIVSISPTTTRAAIEAGLSVTAEATQYDMDGLIDAIVRWETA